MTGNRKTEGGTNRQSNNESENEEDCAADQCLKVFAHNIYLIQAYICKILCLLAFRKRSYMGAMRWRVREVVPSKVIIYTFSQNNSNSDNNFLFL